MGAIPIKTIPFQGGCNTAIEPVLLKPGEYSLIRNMRGQHPGLETRKGQLALHTTADGTNQVMSLYGFSKGRRSEDHLFAQMGDSDVLKATALPPAVTTGVFGAEVFSGAASPIPASWSNLLDKLLFSNGVDQHQIWPGTLEYVKKFVIYSSASAMPAVPGTGKDYTDEVTDGVSTTTGVLGTLGTNATDELMVCCPVVPSGLKLTLGVANTNTVAMTVSYYNGAWTALTKADNTSSGGKTLAQTGTVTWTTPTDAQPYYMYGFCGYWISIKLSAALSATTAVAGAEYLADWQAIRNIWNGILIDSVEAQVYLNASTAYRVYGGAAITVGALTSSDVIYFATADPIEAVYIDVGQIPNTVASTTVNSFLHWTGAAWESVGTFTDGTAGLSKSGWIVIPRLTTTQPHNLNNANVYMYWYKMTVDKTLSNNMVIWVQYRPYFLIDQLGKGVCNAAWKGRAVYSFDRWPDYLYITAQGDPQGLNGNDYGIIQVGDGRSHKVAAMRKFHNELLVWQEEKGEIGGCLTLIEGYSPQTYGKLILSSRLGAMNAKSVAVVDGVLTSTATEEVVKTLAFALSRYGVYATDGRTCSLIDDPIRNYFDPTKTECIRKGYENQMWLAYDSGCNVLRLGLVSGASATVPNVFPVFDLIDKAWSFDTLGQALSCQIDIAAGSGNVPVIQVAGGTADGLVYQINAGANDVSTAISALARMEIGGKGVVIDLREMILRIKAQSAGSMTLTPYINSIAQTAKTLAMTAEIANQTIRRHRFNMNIKGHHISLEFSLNVASQSLYLEDFWPLLIPYQDQ
jgi:hypothetical protein